MNWTLEVVVVPVADVDLESLEGEGVEPLAERKQTGETGA